MIEPEPRWNLIAHIRQQIAAGTYDTPKRMELTALRVHGILSEQSSDQYLTGGLDDATLGPAGHDDRGG